MIRTALICSAVIAALCACDSGSTSDSGASETTPVVRQPIPDGVDPRMVEWRTDGALIPSMDSLRKTPGYVVDSIFPPEEALRRFQSTVNAPRPERLAGGATSADALLRNYWTALVRRDTTAIRALVVNHAEFAYLYFPESAPFASGMQPSAAWILFEGETGRGLTTAFRAAKDQDQRVESTVCRSQERTEGKSRTFGPCGVVRRTGGVADTLWIGSTLIARDGVVKFLGLGNEL
jgi:hypothetical protein